MRPLICLTLAFALAVAASGAPVAGARASAQKPGTKAHPPPAVTAALPVASDERPAGLAPAELCHTLQMNAVGRRLPAAFFVRLIWKESRFDHTAVSKAGAQGIAQFMPPTAEQWGLHNPFDPVQALKKSAELLAYLTDAFGNIGLAAAAYNAGPARVRNWLRGKGRLPRETRDYVAYTTGRPAEDWRDAVTDMTEMDDGAGPRPGDLYSYSLEDWCLQLAGKGREEPWPRAAWSVRVAEDVSQTRALREIRRLNAKLDGAARPLLAPLDKAEPDGRPRFAVDIGLASRKAAWSLCAKMRSRGESCRILRS